MRLSIIKSLTTTLAATMAFVSVQATAIEDEAQTLDPQALEQAAAEQQSPEANEMFLILMQQQSTQKICHDYPLCDIDG